MSLLNCSDESRFLAHCSNFSFNCKICNSKSTISLKVPFLAVKFPLECLVRHETKFSGTDFVVDSALYSVSDAF